MDGDPDLTAIRTGRARDSGVSLHHRLSAILRSRILAGQVPIGAALPGEHALMGLYDVSRATVRRALLTLEQEGLVERRQGKSTLVRYDPAAHAAATIQRRRPSPERVYGGTDVELLGHGPALAAEDCRQALGLTRGSAVYQVTRLRWLGETPLWQVVYHLPLPLADQLRSDDLEAASLMSILRRLGRPAGYSEDRIGAVLADALVAPRLNVDVGAPLLTINRTLMAGEHRPLAFQTCLVPPERHQLAMRVDRAGQAHLHPFHAQGEAAALDES